MFACELCIHSLRVYAKKIIAFWKYFLIQPVPNLVLQTGINWQHTVCAKLGDWNRCRLTLNSSSFLECTQHIHCLLDMVLFGGCQQKMFAENMKFISNAPAWSYFVVVNPQIACFFFSNCSNIGQTRNHRKENNPIFCLRSQLDQKQHATNTLQVTSYESVVTWHSVKVKLSTVWIPPLHLHAVAQRNPILKLTCKKKKKKRPHNLKTAPFIKNKVS